MSEEAVLICGASGLIGKSLVKGFLSKDVKVFASDIKDAKDTQEFTFIKKDLRKESEVKALFSDVFEQLNDKDLSFTLINAQAIADPHSGSIEDLTFDLWSDYIQTNLNSYFFTCRELVRYKDRFKNAHIINLSSTRHLMAEKDTEAYCTTKGAITSFTKALSISVGPKIKANSISPGWIDSPDKDYSDVHHKQHPAGRIGTPEDIFHLCHYLSRSESDFVTGQDFVIDGGMTTKMIYK